jgi:hypothetical protein
LEVSGIPSEPPFAMPFTIALGWFARSVIDPGVVFLCARLTVAVVVVGVLLLAGWRASHDIAVASLAGALTIAQAAFFVHGLEFRYDAAILIGLLIALPALTSARNADFIILGALSAWLATHHVKGLFFGVLLAGLAALRARRRSGAAVRIALGAAGVLCLWGAIAALSGVAGASVRLYKVFFSLGAGAAVRMSPWAALGATFRRDSSWWIVATAALIATVFRLRGRRLRAELDDPDLWALCLAGMALGFIGVHPRPWPYMLALPAPFLAFLIARRFFDLKRGFARFAAVAGTGLVLAIQSLSPPSLFSVVAASFEARRSGEVATLRLMRRMMTPHDRIVDPSGLAYFVPPCTSQWYVDSLFEDEVRQGRWMGAMVGFDPRSCPLVLWTYRLGMLPAGAKDRISRDYVGVSGGLGLFHGDPRIADVSRWPTRPIGPIDSFW